MTCRTARARSALFGREKTNNDQTHAHGRQSKGKSERIHTDRHRHNSHTVFDISIVLTPQSLLYPSTYPHHPLSLILLYPLISSSSRPKMVLKPTPSAIASALRQFQASTHNFSNYRDVPTPKTNTIDLYLLLSPAI